MPLPRAPSARGARMRAAPCRASGRRPQSGARHDTAAGAKPGQNGGTAGDAPVFARPALAPQPPSLTARLFAGVLAGLASVSSPVLPAGAAAQAPPPLAATLTSTTTSTAAAPPLALDDLAAVRDRYDRAAAVRSRWRQANDEGGKGGAAVTTSTSSPAKRRPSSPLPSAGEADAMMLLYDRSAFTDDAWAAMQILRDYARYVDTLADREAATPGATARREALEAVWQTIAQEWAPPPSPDRVSRPFAVAAWAARLQPTLAAAGGVLRSDAALHAAAADLAAALGDRYTEFLPPAAYRLALRRPTAGELAYAAAQAGGGVGIVVDGPAGAPRAARRGARVAAVAAESAAEAAGVRAGDSLMEVERYAVDRLPDSAVAALLRGPAGSDVAVTIAPASGGPPRRLTLERRPLPQPPVKTATLTSPAGRHVAYVRLHYVSHDATEALGAALAAAERAGAGGIVLDLRNDPGGVFEEGVAAASLLLPDGAPVASFDRGGGGGGAESSRTQFVARGGGSALATRAPLALLIDRGTASAAELIAGALADARPRATLVGERSFGKGVVQYYFPLRGAAGGGGVRVTVGAYNTPRGRQPTADKGLAPDVVCDGTPAVDARADACLLAGLRAVDRAAAQWW